MAHVNFRSVADRFTHIDGQIVRVTAERAQDGAVNSARVVLRLYPWWEHPKYLEAIRTEAHWGFDWPDEAERELVIEAVNPIRTEIRAGSSAIDMAFLTEHPLLWEFEDNAEIFCNSNVDRGRLIDAVVAGEPPNVSAENVLRYISPLTADPPVPFSLGSFPATLFGHVKNALTLQGAKLFIPREPAETQPLVLLSIDGNVTIVADDFLVEVPHFEHRSEWFAPGKATG